MAKSDECSRKELTELVTIYAPSLASDGQGGSTVTWNALDGMPTYARVRMLKASEAAAMGRVQAAHSYRVTMRMRSDLTSSCKLRWAGVDYDVRPVQSSGARSAWISFDIEAGVGINV